MLPLRPRTTIPEADWDFAMPCRACKAGAGRWRSVHAATVFFFSCHPCRLYDCFGCVRRGVCAQDAHVCQIGLPMKDQVSFFGVFDGHGGSTVSNTRWVGSSWGCSWCGLLPPGRQSCAPVLVLLFSVLICAVRGSFFSQRGESCADIGFHAPVCGSRRSYGMVEGDLLLHFSP